MREKRKSKRFFEKNRAVINFSVIENDISQDTNLAVTWDISIDGARLFTNKYYAPETKLIISLDLARSKLLVKLWAKVKWSRELNSHLGKYEMGVEFSHSVQTLPDLLKHFYGHELVDSKQKNSHDVNSIPVDVEEAREETGQRP